MGYKKTATAIVVVTLAAFALAGCQSIERETGIGKGGQIGALGGATAGGLIAGLAGAHPAWIAASVILGGVAGGLLGDALDDKDKEQHAASSYRAYESEGKGGKVAWNNAESGNSGATQIDKVYSDAEGKRCKDFTQIINADGESHKANGTACQQPDGSWKVIAS